LSGNDRQKWQALSDRLGVSGSEVLRYALNSALDLMVPLYGPGTHGAQLISAMLKASSDFVRHFRLDAARLVQFVSAGAPADESFISRHRRQRPAPGKRFAAGNPIAAAAPVREISANWPSDGPIAR
jgi:hypothetical protein